MRVASQEFAEEPCSSMKRGAMVRAARALLSSVTRLLILADMVDVHLLMTTLKVVSIDASSPSHCPHRTSNMHRSINALVRDHDQGRNSFYIDLK